jgi:hypothetical protein
VLFGVEESKMNWLWEVARGVDMVRTRGTTTVSCQENRCRLEVVSSINKWANYLAVVLAGKWFC